ncbi:MAG: DUF47 family protein [Lactobacillales bacterium]|nr:DUF47 family protein [Lactobacillales bacterium]
MDKIETGFILFRRTKEIEEKISSFLNNLTASGSLFLEALQSYFKTGHDDNFMRIKEQVSSLEAKNDALRRDVENQLYVHMILPDMRSDILHLLEGMDQIINQYESYLISLSIEKIHYPKLLQADILDMTQMCLACTSALVQATQFFFSGKSVLEHTEHVFPIEHQVDLQAISLKERIFSNKKTPLAEKVQMRDFIKGIEIVSDIAEDVTDDLIIISVKHTL